MRYTILIADDEKITLHLIKKYLQKSENHYSILTASNGQEAVKIAQKNLPDLILMDWQMPILNGTEAIIELKKSSRTSKIPIILHTNLDDSKKLQEALDSGAIDFIKKPVEKIELLTRIKTTLRLQNALEETEYNKQRIDDHIDELNKLTLIIKETANSVILINPDGEIEWANEGFTKMYGISFPEFIEKHGRNIFDVSFNKGIVKKKFKELNKTKKSVSYVANCSDKDTPNKWIQTTLTPIFDGNQIEKIVAIETDITKGKESERNLLKQNKEMQELTEELKVTNTALENQKKLIEDERNKTDELLSNILPHHVAVQLKSIGYARPRNYRRATIMFTDFKGFTKSCENLSPDQIVTALHTFFTEFDEIVVQHFIEKIKTIGDAYMCVGGIPLRNRSNPFDVVLAGLKIQKFMNDLHNLATDEELPKWKLRLGIHTGPIIAGVVGKIKFAYDVWGDSVNIASRMETAGEVGKVNISGSTYKYVKDYFDCEYRGEIEIKNRGKIDMYFVNGIKEGYASEKSAAIPNKKFKAFLHTL